MSTTFLDRAALVIAAVLSAVMLAIFVFIPSESLDVTVIYKGF
jgi:hypothetical protein